MDNEYIIGLPKTPLVPEGVETNEALNSDVFDEDGFQDDTTLDEVEDTNNAISEAIVELAKLPCKFFIV